MAQSSAGIGYAPRRGHPRCAVPWVLSPHPSPLPWGEGEPFSPRRTIQTHRLSTARCALFPLPEGEGQGGETARTTIPRIGPFPEFSNWVSPPAEPEVSPNDCEIHQKEPRAHRGKANAAECHSLSCLVAINFS